MKNNFKILLVSFYVAVLLGLVLHTSSHPEIFGKYTIKYLSVLILLTVLFPIFIRFLKVFFEKNKISLLNFKIRLNLRNRLLTILFLLIIITLPSEIFLRFKYNNFESENYSYTVDNFHPFLQSRIAKNENLNVNSLGFRGEEISSQKPENTYRIFVLGGSTVLNREVPFEKSAVRLLEKKLRREFPNRKIEVINAGKDFYTSEHSIIQYMFKIADLEPDLVISWQGINDMLESCTSEGIVTHGKYEPDYSHNFGAIAKVIFEHFRPQPILSVKLLSFDFLMKNLSANLYSDVVKQISESVRKRLARIYMSGEDTVNVKTFESINAYSRNLQYLIDLTRKEEVPLIVGNQPSLFKDRNSLLEVERIMFPVLACKQGNKNYSIPSLKNGLDSYNNLTSQVAKKNGVLFIDLDKNVPKNLNYFLDMVHYTELGNEQVAETLLNFIVQHDLINSTTNK